MKVALLISTYNWPESLDLVFKSILIQSKMPDEILIADDGSNFKTKTLVEDYQNLFSIPFKYFWQEDLGFRKSKILNKAVAGTNADYIIQIDGDCIIHEKFIEDHLKFAQREVYLYGSRVNILPNFVEEVLTRKKISFNFFSKEIKNKTRTLYVPFFSRFYRIHKGVSEKFRGCNVSFWRDDFILINGYNEDFEGWGREDSDLVIRMGNSGVKARRIRYAGIVFHVYHKTCSKEKLDINDKLQLETISKSVIKITNGVDKYL